MHAAAAPPAEGVVWMNDFDFLLVVVGPERS
jgi:hypothetical protein